LDLVINDMRHSVEKIMTNDEALHERVVAAVLEALPAGTKHAISIRIGVSRLFQKKGKVRFLDGLKAHSKILDVGCGERWPLMSKRVRPDCYYIGLDIHDFDDVHMPSQAADQYVVAAKDDFASSIESFSGQIDAVISAHNLEHCNAPASVLRAMCTALRPDGLLYLSFPSQDSIAFPKRKGTLNFYDDPTHRNILDLTSIMRTIEEQGLTVRFSAKRYRPFLLMLVGLVLEPISALTRKVMPLGTTWALYGFETVIWAQKKRL